MTEKYTPIVSVVSAISKGAIAQILEILNMARSSLLRLLRKAYRLHYVSRKTGIPADELMDQAKEKAQNRGISRRRMLQGSLAIATAMVTSTAWPRSSRPVIAQQMRPVLIVGAGMAGLMAAYRLHEAGVPVEIMEARSRIGGRMYSRRQALGSEASMEIGGEWIDTNHVAIRSLAEELELELVDLFEVEAGLTPQTYFFGGRKVSEEEVLRDFAPIAAQIEADLATIEDFEDYTTPIPAAVALDQISLADYVDSIEASEMIRNLLKVSYTTFVGLPAEEQSCLNLLYVVSTDLDELALYGESDERFYTRGGNDQMPRMIADRLHNFIQTDTILESLRQRPDGWYQASMRSGLRTWQRSYERVVLTVPFSVLRDVELNIPLPEAKRLAINELGYGTNNKLVTAYEEKIWRDRYQATGLTFSDLPYQETREASSTRFTPGPSFLVHYMGGRLGVDFERLTTPEAVNRVLPQFERVFPGLRQVHIPGKTARTAWVGDPFSRGSYSCYKVGQITQMYGVEGERVGNLFFAGEHTSLEFQGYMEGACETGEAAALAIIEDLGLLEEAARLRQRRSHQLAARTYPRRAQYPFRRRAIV